MSKRTGRPPWTPPDSATVEELAAHGLTNEQIALSLGISSATLYAKEREFSEFSDAIKRGRARGISSVANTLYQAAMNGNVTAAIFFLKARAGWRDAGDGAQVNVNIGDTSAFDREEQGKQRRMALLSKMTVEEKRELRDLLLRAEQRMRGEEVEGDARAIEYGSNGGAGGQNQGGSGSTSDAR